MASLITENEQIATEQVLKEEISQSIRKTEIGQVEVYPGRELALANIYDVGLVFEFVEKSKYTIERKAFKADSLDKSEIGDVDIAQCVVVKWEDFLHCTLHRDVKKGKETAVFVEIISCVPIGVNKMNCKRRERNVIRFIPHPPVDTNCMQEAWVDRINLNGRRFVQRKYKCVRALSDGELLAKKRVLVLVNPFSGSRGAVKTFHSSVDPFLRDAGIEFELFVTQRAGHARERLQHEDLDKWDALLFLSGDGLVYEVLNGLLARDDASVTIQKPIGIIPCGSGNTTIGSILYYSHEEYSVLNAAFVFVKGMYGSTQTLDVGLFKQGAVTSYFFIALNWGFTADLTIHSDFLRSFGEARFAVGALFMLWNTHLYRADISYLPFDENNPIGSLDEVAESSWHRLEGPFANIFITLVPKLSRSVFIAPMHQFGSGQFTLVNLPYENLNRFQILKLLFDAKRDDMSVFSAFSYTKIKAFRLTPIYPQDGNLRVDGEVVPYETCYGEVSPYKMCVISMFEQMA